MQLLRRSGYQLHTTAEFEIVKQIKHKWCYVAPFGQLMPDDLYNLPSNKPQIPSSSQMTAAGTAVDHQTNYFLPDGQQVSLSKEKILAPEILFQPDRIGLEYPGIHEMVVNAIKKCDLDLRKTLYNSIIAAGGTTMLHGFGDRLHKSIQKLAKDIKVSVIMPDNRVHSCWIGGSLVSSLNAFNKMWITKKQYDEEGGYRALMLQSM